MNIEKIKDHRCCCSIAAGWIADGWYHLAHPDWKLRKSNKPWQRDLRSPPVRLEGCLGEGMPSMPSNPNPALIHPRRPRGRWGGGEGKSKRAGKHGTKTFPHPHYLPLGLRGYTGTGVRFQGIDGIPPPKHPSRFPGGNADPVVMVPIHTIPNAPTHLTILFDQSLSTKKPIPEKSQSE